MFRDGSKVSYVGDDDVLAVGDTAKVLSAASETCHVRWLTGKRTGDISLVANMDLVAMRASAPTAYEENFTGPLVTVAVRDTFDTAGPVGLLDALNEEGHLATFAQFAEEALQSVAAKINQDPSIREVLSHLEPEEASEFVSLAASVLLRDAFGGEEG